MRRSVDIGAVTNVSVTAVTPAGRVGTLTVNTDHGKWSLRGNEIRSALSTPAGDLLYSTYFSVDVVAGRSGVERVTLHGGGNGHGVGMCVHTGPQSSHGATPLRSAGS